MKTIGIQIKSTEAIIVVLEKDANGNIKQSNESTKLKIQDPSNQNQIKQFRDQINSALDNINADRIAILARNAKAKGTMAPSPVSFKLEGIIQLYSKKDIELVWPQTLVAHYKKNPSGTPNHTYQQDAFDLAHYISKN
jgi:hypothetical protein